MVRQASLASAPTSTTGVCMRTQVIHHRHTAQHDP
jgi:hypothetical protein